MSRFTEETLNSWRKPPSDAEETKLTNAERMVREAISEDDILSSKSTRIFGQGSYANDTNVKLNSDIDINVQYTGGFYYQLLNDTTQEDAGIGKLSSSTYSYSEFKDDVEKAMVKKFGRNSVKRKNKCITILANNYRVETDVVPTWELRRYDKNNTPILGARFFPDDGGVVTNYPEQHIQNGKDKNARTQKRFKRLTRIHRKLRYKMIEDGEKINDGITSFLLECLVWNIPDYIFNNNDTWTDRLKESIRFVYLKTKEDKECKEWGEVSDLLYLFTGSRKWSREDVNRYMMQVWNYLEFK
ncbi:nucleotidyltransferase domain-containing protein [Polaribacter cellanae]|uniref:Nucleotidyltransferase n=1 Tax=Polaribacter cellanae TaxID=2818493 RepID=A0A975CJV6_9FLAO|nr:nucleotidyltransferase [Polaribacter cellanae]QTE21093.1 nucleotidyltransferase [Polaribacter cellanae]